VECIFYITCQYLLTPQFMYTIYHISLEHLEGSIILQDRIAFRTFLFRSRSSANYAELLKLSSTFLSLICPTSTRPVLVCHKTNTALVMHFASPLFPVLPGGVNPISLPGYPSSSDLCTLHTISIFYFAQSFGLHSLPYFFILQSINFTPNSFLYRTHIF
jgi:hypothetical protein